MTQILDLFNFKHYINSTYQGVEEWEFVVLRMSSGCDLLDPDSVVLNVEEEGVGLWGWPGGGCSGGGEGQSPPLLQPTANS